MILAKSKGHECIDLGLVLKNQAELQSSVSKWNAEDEVRMQLLERGLDKRNRFQGELTPFDGGHDV